MIEKKLFCITENNIINPRLITAPGIAYPRDINWLIKLFSFDFVNFSVNKKIIEITIIKKEEIREIPILLNISFTNSKRSVFFIIEIEFNNM